MFIIHNINQSAALCLVDPVFIHNINQSAALCLVDPVTNVTNLFSSKTIGNGLKRIFRDDITTCTCTHVHDITTCTCTYVHDITTCTCIFNLLRTTCIALKTLVITVP